MFQLTLGRISPRPEVISKKFRGFCDFQFVYFFLPRMDIIGNPYQIENKDFLSMTKICKFFLTNWEGVQSVPFVPRHFDKLFTSPVF